MAGWVDPQDQVLSAVTSLAAELADPVRLTALQLLAAEGPHTMSQLADAIGVSAPRLGNHLARLRAAGLVTVEHTGRHAIYQVVGPGVGEVLGALSRYAQAGSDATGAARPAGPADIAHTCYDHAAGRLGVTLFASLVERGALVAPDGRSEELALGQDPTAFTELGIDATTVDAGRRKLATACLDRTHRLPHLGGALGAAVLDRFVERGLVRRASQSRLLTITPQGRSVLPRLIPAFVVVVGGVVPDG